MRGKGGDVRAARRETSGVKRGSRPKKRIDESRRKQTKKKLLTWMKTLRLENGGANELNNYYKLPKRICEDFFCFTFNESIEWLSVIPWEL